MIARRTPDQPQGYSAGKPRDGRIGSAPLAGLARRLALLQTAAALCEAAGLVLLVPLLGALAAALGNPVRPDLALITVLALLGALLGGHAWLLRARHLLALKFALAVVDDLRRRAPQPRLLTALLDRVRLGIGQLLLATQALAALLALALAAVAIAVLGQADLLVLTIVPLLLLLARAGFLLGRLRAGWQQWQRARPALAEAEALIAQLSPDVDEH